MSPFHFESKAPIQREGRSVVVPKGLKTPRELFALLQKEVPLPDYFGHNWDALEECLGDLEWLKETKLILLHHDLPFSGKPEDQRTYLQVLAAADLTRLSIIFPERERSHVTKLLAGV